jgi:hypothetical protein
MHLPEQFPNYQFYVPMFYCFDLASGSAVHLHTAQRLSQFDTIFKADTEMPSSSMINVDVSSALLLRLQVFSDVTPCPRRPESSSGMF